MCPDVDGLVMKLEKGAQRGTPCVIIDAITVQDILVCHHVGYRLFFHANVRSTEC